MSDISHTLDQMTSGDPSASVRLFELVDRELRTLAARKLSQENTSGTLPATALIHEAWLHLIDEKPVPSRDGKGHFLSAAAEAMRRILIEYAQQRNALQRGDDHQRAASESVDPAIFSTNEEAIEFENALCRLETLDVNAAQIVKLKVFAGLSVEQTAQALGLSNSTVYQNWAYARAWLSRELRSQN